MIPIYRHSSILTSLKNFAIAFLKVRQLSPVHPTVNGCVVLIHDEQNDITYRLHLDIVRSEKEVKSPDVLPDDLSFNFIANKWGIENAD